MSLPDQNRAGYSTIPSSTFLSELRDDEMRDSFVADHLKTRLALQIKALRDQRDWPQAELGRRMGKPQNVVSRLEDPEYGKMSVQTLLEVASAYKLPLYIDFPDWDEWFRLMADMSAKTLERTEFDADKLGMLKQEEVHGSAEKTQVDPAPPPVIPDKIVNPEDAVGIVVPKVPQPMGMNLDIFATAPMVSEQMKVDFPCGQDREHAPMPPTSLNHNFQFQGLARL